MFIFCCKYDFTNNKKTGIDANAIHAGGRQGSCCHKPDVFIAYYHRHSKAAFMPYRSPGQWGEQHWGSPLQNKGALPSTQEWPPNLIFLSLHIKCWDFKHVNLQLVYTVSGSKPQTSCIPCKHTSNWVTTQYCILIFEGIKEPFFFLNLIVFGNFIYLNRIEINCRKLILVIV